MCWQMFGLLVWKLRKLLKQLCATWSRKCPSGAFRKFIKQKKRKDFVFPFKASRRVALSEMDKQNKRSVSAVTASQYARSVSDLPVPTACEGGTAVSSCQRIYLDKVPFPLLLIASVVTDHEGKSSVLYLVTSDLTQVFPPRKHRLDGSAMVSLYKKRWKIEEYHKSIKSVKTSFHLCNAAFAKSPTRRLRTQSNHFFASLVAFVNLEAYRATLALNHFALRGKVYQAAVASAYEQLQRLKATCLQAAIIF